MATRPTPVPFGTSVSNDGHDPLVLGIGGDNLDHRARIAGMIVSGNFVDVHHVPGYRRVVVVVFVGSEPENGKIPPFEGAEPFRFVAPQKFVVSEKLLFEKKQGGFAK